MIPDGNQPNILLVEGQEDQYIVKYLWEKYKKRPCPFGISNKKGVDKLIESISSEMKVSNRKTLGILVDANGNPGKRLEQISTEFKKNQRFSGKDLHTINPDGIIINGPPRTGVWMMPDNKSQGEIEDFIKEMIPKGDPIWPSAEKYIENISQEHRLFSNNKVTKAKVLAWVATRKDPYIGLTILKDNLDLDNELAQNFIKWLSNLFASAGDF